MLEHERLTGAGLHHIAVVPAYREHRQADPERMSATAGGACLIERGVRLLHTGE